MKVFANAFQLQSTDLFPVDEFFDSLVAGGIIEFVHSGRQRYLSVDQTRDYYCGILLSERDHQNFVVLGRDHRDRLTVQVKNSPAGQPMGDVNFIVLKKGTQAGLFTAYHGSGGIVAFGNMLGKIYKERSLSKADQIIEERGEADDIDDAEEQSIRKVHRKVKLSLMPILTDPNFVRELRRLARVRTFEFVEVNVNDARFGPVRREVEKRRQAYYFKKENVVDRLINFLASFVRDSSIHEGRVLGNLPNGDNYEVPIEPEISCLAKYEHDEVVTPENMHLDRIARLPMIRELIGVAESNAEIFTGQR
ncbi:MAG: hypothetical protein C0483_04740 [Pirellula sp.]|nr:hypothetical protein [Pirellula sp.]